MTDNPTTPPSDEEPLTHVGWWCWRGDNHGHLATMACRSDNVPIHVPAEWADEMRAVIQRIEDGDDEPAAASAVSSPPPDQTAGPACKFDEGCHRVVPCEPGCGTSLPDQTLRDRIRRAVCEAEGFAWDSDMLEPDEYGDHADMVLAVLPPAADRGAVLREAAEQVVAADLGPRPGRNADYTDGWSDATLRAQSYLRLLADQSSAPRPDAEARDERAAALHMAANYVRGVSADRRFDKASVSTALCVVSDELRQMVQPAADGSGEEAGA